MVRNYKVLRIGLFFVLVVFCAFNCIGCKKNEEAVEINMGETVPKFPLKANGYPEDVVMINGSIYPLEDISKAYKDHKKEQTIELDLKADDKSLEVVLPMRSAVHFWDVGRFIDVVEYKKVISPIREENMLDGCSSEFQVFNINIAHDENRNISFKWSNVNEIEKSFNDREEDYILKIKISH